VTLRIPQDTSHHGDDTFLRPQLVARQVASEAPSQLYRPASLPDASQFQSRFFEADYSRELRQMALAIVEAEGPVRDDVIARRIARAHGFARTGAKIKERVLALIPEVTFTDESVGRFLWATDRPSDWVPYRFQMPDDERRSLDEIAIQELVGLVRQSPEIHSSDDPAIELARRLGLARLAKSARERLEAAIERGATGGSPVV
jgi:hypothetical protein